MECDGVAVARHVEDAELWHLVGQTVHRLAERRRDELLATVWYAVVDRGWRLREVADLFGLTISQVHRRIEAVRDYLRHSPDVRQWLCLCE